MRDYNLTHIPDLTERYPEGFDGIDMYAGYDPEYEFWKTVEEAERYEHEEYEEGHQVLSDYEQDMKSISYLIDGPKKFKEGQEYESVCWFTGGVGYYTVKKRTDKEVTFAIGRHELDGDHKCEDETFDLKFDKHGNEYITLYEYGDHENNIRAGYDGYGNEIY